MSQTNATTIITSCPSCKSLYQVPDAAVGKEVACKKCGSHFHVAVLKKETPPLPEICQVLLNYNLAGKEILMLAIEEFASQKSKNPGQTLESFLVERGVVSKTNMGLAKDIESVWKKRLLEKQFSAIAVKAGFISQESANDALKEQAILFKESRKTISIGDILVKKNQLTPQQRDAIFKKQNRLDEIPSAQPAATPPPPSEKTMDTDIHDLIEKTKGIVIEGPGFEIIVSIDRSTAFFRATERFTPMTPIDDIEKILDENKISYGVMKHDDIRKKLDSAENGKPVFRIAESTAPEIGKEGRIIMHFDTTPRKAGRIGEDGQIDFKDRGEIPHVKEGELLAEKVPAVQGIPGIDVYGDTIPVETIEDPTILYGSGVILSEDGLKLFAKVKGQPQLSVGGRISVLDELMITGDVGYKTGHIEFDGNILITGTIQNGFRVKGGNVKVTEVNGGELELTGSLVVLTGITDAKINALGDVTAKFIGKSVINTFGDILVSKMIIDSEITCGGSCKAPGGKIISSDISAKYGIEAVDIGNDMSRPCKLKAGHDDHLAKEIDGINAAIERNRSAIKGCQDLNKKLQKEEEETHMSIAEQAHIQDRSQIEIRQTKSQIADLKKEGNLKEIPKLEMKVKELEKNAAQAEKEINALFDRQEKVIESVENNKKKIAILEPKLWELSTEKNNILHYAKKEKGIAIVKATGTIYAGTTITGVHSSRIMGESLRRAQIKEMRVTDPDSQVEYEMRLIK